MNTKNIGFYEEMVKSIFQLSSSIIKYTLVSTSGVPILIGLGCA